MKEKDFCPTCLNIKTRCICSDSVERSQVERQGYDANPPREYELDKPEELQRLYRELAGYMKNCRDCGGDFEGRRFAREALDKLRTAT